MAGHSKKVVLFALVANLGIAIAKFIAWLFTRSPAMIAEAIHSVADTSNQILLLFGMYRAARPPSEHHQFGYKMESYFWSFVVAILLFSLGGLFAIYHGYHALQEAAHAEMPNYTAAIIVLCVGLLLEGYSWLVATQVVNRLRGPMSLPRFIRRSKSPEVIVVWLEDTGALLGMFIALVGIVLAMITGDVRWDAYASLTIGALLVVIAIVVARETKSLLIGEAASLADQAAIREVVDGFDGVERLLRMRTMQLGEDEILVALAIVWRDDLSGVELAEGINRLEAGIREVVPRARYLFVEPDLAPPTA
ncbi:MAG: cation diffusion facilitator family transporter [Planctomycetota bacterium]|jgi:cation diffusion facilitator family transporter